MSIKNGTRVRVKPGTTGTLDGRGPEHWSAGKTGEVVGVYDSGESWGDEYSVRFAEGDYPEEVLFIESELEVIESNGAGPITAEDLEGLDASDVEVSQ